MKKFIVVVFLISFSNCLNAQVGIGTTNPYSQLDIRASNQATPQNNDGILIPKVDNFPTTVPTVNQDGMVVYATGNGTPTKGFYYWDNALLNWVVFSTGGQDHDWYEQGTTTAPNNINDNKFTFGNIGIGKNIANWPLDVESTVNGRAISVLVNGSSNSAGYGLYNIVSSTGTGAQFGVSNIVSGAGNGAKYGSYNFISATSGGTHYGVFSSATKTGSYAGYFNGDLFCNDRLILPSANDATQLDGSGVIEIGGYLRIDDNELITDAFGTLSLQRDNSGILRVDETTLVVDGSTNRVGIGTGTPSYQLELTTNSAAKPTSSAWSVTSDSRLKKDIKPFTDGLESIKKIDPVWFTYNGKANMPNETGVGTIAQDFQKIAPYMVSTWEYRKDVDSKPEEYLAIDYGPLNFVIVNAIKEQQEIIEKQQSEIDFLKKELDEMKVSLNTISSSLKN